MRKYMRRVCALLAEVQLLEEVAEEYIQSADAGDIPRAARARARLEEILREVE